MSDRLAATITLYGLFLAAFALLPLVAGARPGPVFIAGTVLFELALAGQAVAAAIAWAGGHEPGEPSVFAGYLLASVAVLPAAAAFGERRTAWDIAVVAVACIALAVVSQRMAAVW
jgi:hypothetical protein